MRFSIYSRRRPCRSPRCELAGRGTGRGRKPRRDSRSSERAGRDGARVVLGPAGRAHAPARVARGYLRINPSARERLSELHRCEPYVYAQMIAGRDAPTHGEAKNSWLTGTAAWNLVAVTQWILGIRPEHDGLRIDPCLPADWTGFEAERRFRGATYRITVRKARGVRGRVAALLVDGDRLDGAVVPARPTGAVVDVVAVVEADGRPAPRARRPRRTARL